MLLTMLITGHIWSQVGGNIVSRAADTMHLFRWLFYLLQQAVCVVNNTENISNKTLVEWFCFRLLKQIVLENIQKLRVFWTTLQFLL